MFDSHVKQRQLVGFQIFGNAWLIIVNKPRDAKVYEKKGTKETNEHAIEVIIERVETSRIQCAQESNDVA